MNCRLLLIAVLLAGFASCKPSGSDAQRAADEKRISELRDLEERAAQRDAEAKANQLEADRQKLADDQAALDRERQQLAAERDAARNDPQKQAQVDATQRRFEQREAEQRAAQERADAEERAVIAARDARESKREAAAKKIDFFYDALDPLGDWMEVQPYGYVWQPREARTAGYRPYTDGTWVYTDYGWTWKGNEPFGWATDHYGRWTRLRDRGWVWVPGSEWAPAWVSWRESPQYVGWAPLPPEAHSRNGFDGAVDSYYDIGPTAYNFIPSRSFGEPTYRGIVVDPERNYTFINETSNVTRMRYTNYGRESVYYNDGPNFDEVSRYSSRPIARYRLERESSLEHPGSGGANSVAGNVLRLLAPQVASASRAVAAPPRVTARLGTAAPDHGWGTSSNPNAQGFRAKLQQEATQAQEIARTQPPTTPPRSGSFGGAGLPPASGGSFGTGPTPTRPAVTAPPPRGPGGSFGTGPTPLHGNGGSFGSGPTPRPSGPFATPRPVGGINPLPITPKPLTSGGPSQNPLGAPATPPLGRIGNAFTPPPSTPKASRPTPPAGSIATPSANPGTPLKVNRVREPGTPPMNKTTPGLVRATPSFEPATPRPPKQPNPNGNIGAFTPRPLPPVAPKSTDVPVPHSTPPATLPNPKTRPATGSGGLPVIPASTPRSISPSNPDGGPDPRKTLPPKFNSATPAPAAGKRKSDATPDPKKPGQGQ